MVGTTSKDTADILWYSIDWSIWLGADTIASSVWTVPAGITKVTSTNTSTKTLIKISGGTTATSYTVTNTITTTTDQETKVETFTLKIK